MRYILYLSFRRLFSFQRRFRRRLTRGGRLLFFGIIAAAVVGIDTNRSMGYQAFSLMTAMLLTAAAATPFFRARLSARRHLPRFGTVGQPFTYRIEIRNRSGRSQQGLLFFEEGADPRPDFQTFANTPEPGERGRNRFDRWIKFYRWQWLVGEAGGDLPRGVPLPPLAPGETGSVEARIIPGRRGPLRLKGITVARPDPLGLVNAHVRLALPQSVMVLPRRYDLPPIRLPGSRRYQSGGVALTTSVGESEEFVSLRDYRPGDPIRHIHWKSWARTRKPVVKEYQEEFYVRHALVLDTFYRGGRTPAFEDAVSVAASFAYTVRTQDSLLDLIFVGPEAYCFTSGRGLASSERTLEVLASVSPCRDQPFETLPPLVLRRADALSGCICVLLSWDAPRRDFVGRLRALGLPTLVLVVVSESAGQLDPGPMADRMDRLRPLREGRIAEDLARL
jgi:uncharacterized protein (DUF58 family)